LAGNPKVLLADEPTGNLDFRTGEMIVSLLADLHRSHQLTSIYVTHNISFAASCDRVLQLDKGILTPWSGEGRSGEAWLPSRPEPEQPMILGDGGNYV
jgi:ABC-type lipoprotein export system ATPase subunit